VRVEHGRLSDKHKRTLKKGYLRQQKAEARTRMVLDEAEFDALRTYLQDEAAHSVCDRSLRLTCGWASGHGVTPTQLAGSLSEFGADCDCQVLSNVAPEAIF
jgi:Protein of unknown function (DUF2695)